MTFTFDLETRFKITADPLHKDTLCDKYEPDWVKGREDMLRTRDLGRTEGRTDGLIAIARPQSGALII